MAQKVSRDTTDLIWQALTDVIGTQMLPPLIDIVSGSVAAAHERAVSRAASRALVMTSLSFDRYVGHLRWYFLIENTLLIMIRCPIVLCTNAHSNPTISERGMVLACVVCNRPTADCTCIAVNLIPPLGDVYLKQ